MTDVLDLLRTADGEVLAASLLAGAGDTCVVLAHGFSGSSAKPAVRRIAAGLAPHASVLSYDARGHGLSTGRTTLGDREVLAWIAEHVAVGTDDVILDVAGGAGHLGRHLAEQGRFAVVVDLTRELLAAGAAAGCGGSCRCCCRGPADATAEAAAGAAAAAGAVSPAAADRSAAAAPRGDGEHAHPTPQPAGPGDGRGRRARRRGADDR